MCKLWVFLLLLLLLNILLEHNEKEKQQIIISELFGKYNSRNFKYKLKYDFTLRKS